jgi:hypothetical protein
MTVAVLTLLVLAIAFGAMPASAMRVSPGAARVQIKVPATRSLRYQTALRSLNRLGSR